MFTILYAKIVVLYLDSDNKLFTNDQLIQPGDFSHLNMAYTMYIELYSQILQPSSHTKMSQEGPCVSLKKFSFSFKVFFTVQ